MKETDQKWQGQLPPSKGLFLAWCVSSRTAYHSFWSPVSGAIVKKGQTLDKPGVWSLTATLPTAEHTQALVWLTLSPTVHPAPPAEMWAVDPGWEGCEFGGTSVLDPLAKIPGWRNPLGFLVSDEEGRRGWGRKMRVGKKGRKTEYRG